jgi:hypothetical protein
MDMDVSYSWSGNSGGGEFTYWPYGYHYSWGNKDTFGEDRARMAIESESNVISRNYTTYSTEDIRPLDERLHQSNDANEPPPQASMESFIDKPAKSE